ncbi:MAG TPA: S9 family peptidase [Anaerolineae bacterium]|nr:S9 family peptidase [Anaerolineae bacterium]
MTTKDTSMKYKPMIKDMLLLPVMGDSWGNPDGTIVAFRKAYANMQENKTEAPCFLFDVQTETTHRLTRRGTSNIRWLTNDSLALLKRTENGIQAFLFEDLIGEGVQVTDHPGGIQSFELFANGLVYLAQKPNTYKEARQNKFGNYVHVEEEESDSALYYVDLDAQIQSKDSRRDFDANGGNRTTVELSLLLEQPLHIESLLPSTPSNAIFINCRTKDDLYFEYETSCFHIIIDPDTVLEQEGADPSSLGSIKQIMLPSGARIQAVSPDGSKLLVSHQERGLKQYVQSDLWILDLSTRQDQLKRLTPHEHLQCITQDLDQEPLEAFWSESGIHVRFWDESTQKLARISESGDVEEIDLLGLTLDATLFANPVHVNQQGYLSFRGNSPTEVTDIYLGKPKGDGFEYQRITHNCDRVKSWDLGTVESIRWTSKDGTEIEGVLHKPSDFDPSKKYPLLFRVHGGPAASSANCLLNSDTTYPMIQLINKGILILEPNYRGSLGRGQAFLELNVDNLGIGDLWDLESAIDHLSAQGFIDEENVGSMGWSQGGYISSFVAMHSTRFKAVSAGAALCSWYNYFSGSDNRQSYNLSESPFENRELYERTAPISGIDTAQTPIMFQHGENDQRVPLTSAMEMYRALKAKGIETELFVYPGMGHGWLSPRENYALMVQNYRWFAHHLLGEELDFTMDDEGNALTIEA